MPPKKSTAKVVPADEDVPIRAAQHFLKDGERADLELSDTEGHRPHGALDYEETDLNVRRKNVDSDDMSSAISSAQVSTLSDESDSEEDLSDDNEACDQSDGSPGPSHGKESERLREQGKAVTVEVPKLAWDKMIDIVSLDAMGKTRNICASTADAEHFLHVLDTLVDRITPENDDGTKTRLKALPNYKKPLDKLYNMALRELDAREPSNTEFNSKVKSMWEKRTKAGTTRGFDFEDFKETCYSVVYNTRKDHAPKVAKLVKNILVNPNYFREQAEKSEEVRAIYGLNHKEGLDVELGALADTENDMEPPNKKRSGKQDQMKGTVRKDRGGDGKTYGHKRE